MSARRDDELPTIDLSTLSRVTGGAGTDLSSMMMPMMMMMNKKKQSAAAGAASAAAAPVAPPTPQITLNGVPQTPSSMSSAGTNYTTPDMSGDDSDF